MAMYELRYRDRDLIDMYIQNVKSDIPIVMIMDDLLDFMVKRKIDHFDVPGHRSQTGKAIRFVFKIIEYEDKTVYDFEGVKRI